MLSFSTVRQNPRTHYISICHWLKETLLCFQFICRWRFSIYPSIPCTLSKYLIFKAWNLKAVFLNVISLEFIKVTKQDSSINFFRPSNFPSCFIWRRGSYFVFPISTTFSLQVGCFIFYPFLLGFILIWFIFWKYVAKANENLLIDVDYFYKFPDKLKALCRTLWNQYGPRVSSIYFALESCLGVEDFFNFVLAVFL